MDFRYESSTVQVTITLMKARLTPVHQFHELGELVVNGGSLVFIGLPKSRQTGTRLVRDPVFKISESNQRLFGIFHFRRGTLEKRYLGS